MDVKLQHMIYRPCDVICMVRSVLLIILFFLNITNVSITEWLWVSPSALCCYLTGEDVLRKGHADLRWTPLWCFSCMCFTLPIYLLISILAWFYCQIGVLKEDKKRKICVIHWCRIQSKSLQGRSMVET